MKERILDLIQDPYTRDEIEYGENCLVNTVTGAKYRYDNDIYYFIEEDNIEGQNLKYSKFYDKIAWSYNLSNKIYFYLKFGNEYKARSEYLDELEIKEGDKVLEISIGTADNLPYINHKAQFYGLDISKGMLKMAVRHLKKWKIHANLFHGEAENLPFKDNSFDVVYHVGGINYFSDKQKAINEMIRVAKPGTKILIADETEKLVKEVYQKNPFSKKHYKDTSNISTPVHLVPKEMADIEVNIINRGLFYSLTFRKPFDNV